MSTCVLVFPSSRVWPSACARDLGGAGHPAAATTIFNDDGADARFHHLRPDAADDIGCASRRERNDESNRPLGIGEGT
jgi:hypothetical protein